MGLARSIVMWTCKFLKKIDSLKEEKADEQRRALCDDQGADAENEEERPDVLQRPLKKRRRCDVGEGPPSKRSDQTSPPFVLWSKRSRE